MLACQNSENNTIANSQLAPFFDVERYFKDEIKRLEAQNIHLQKKISLGEKTEEKILKEYNLTDELSFFLDANINKPAWLDQYTVDSTLVQNQLKALHYVAKEDKLKIKEINIDFEKKIVSKIKIIKRNPTIIAEAEQILEYQAQSGYSIEHRQETRLGKPQDLRIQVAFVAP